MYISRNEVVIGVILIVDIDIKKCNAIGDDLLKVTNDGELDKCDEQKLEVYGKLKVKIFENIN